jgi:peptidyl-prolyl cis-trans isomerase SurA
MKIKLFISSICLIFFATSIFGQENDEKVLLTVGDEKISRVEFERIYLKNNQMVSDMDKKSLDEYLELFVIYKLKVAEAKAMELDKTEAFKKELDGYRKQLVQPFLTDKETEEKLLSEAYERMKFEVDASHILISIPEKATPEDTLAIYEKTMKIRQRIIDGEPFESVAKATSDDPSVKRNGGRLGYFSAFQMVYPFECAAFETPVGKISMPIRTRFGYHLVKTNDKRHSVGQLKTAHIMIAIPQNAPAEQQVQAKARIDSIYRLVLNNENFANLARNFSQDPGSARNGGELPYFGPGRMVPEFDKAAFALERDGQVSEPVRSQFGWHIIKRLDKKLVGTYDEMLPEIKNKISRDERGRISRDVFIKSMKENYGFSIDSSTLKSMESLLDENYYTGNWQIPLTRKLDQPLFQFAGQQYSLRLLAEKMRSNQKNQSRVPFAILIERNFNDLVEETIVSFEEERLIKENPDFFYLLKEYYDGILLFEIMDRNVWSKAAYDVEGLTEFYNDNIDSYKWERRIHTTNYILPSEPLAKKAYKLAASKKGVQLTNDDFKKQLSSNENELITINDFATIPEDVAVKGYENWSKGLSPIIQNEKGYSFHRFIKMEVNEPIPMDEIRGKLIADYQEFLEKQWIDLLKKKYEVVINKDLYEQISSSFN